MNNTDLAAEDEWVQVTAPKLPLNFYGTMVSFP